MVKIVLKIIEGIWSNNIFQLKKVKRDFLSSVLRLTYHLILLYLWVCTQTYVFFSIMFWQLSLIFIRFRFSRYSFFSSTFTKFWPLEDYVRLYLHKHDKINFIFITFVCYPRHILIKAPSENTSMESQSEYLACVYAFLE